MIIDYTRSLLLIFHRVNVPEIYKNKALPFLSVMPKARNHEKSRSLVCLICWSKIFGNGGRILKPGAKLTCLIKDKYAILNNYDPSELTLPNAICSTCCRTLYKFEKNATNAPLIKACAYSINSDSTMHTRGCSSAAACNICQIAREQYRPSSRDPCLCPTCCQVNQVQSTSNYNTGNSTENKPGPQFTATNLLNIQAEQNLSNKQIINIASSLRSICGRKSVEPGFRDKLQEVSKKLDSFYSSISANFKISDKEGYGDRDLVFCHDVEGLIEFILNDRGYDPFNHLICVGLDGGGGIFKIIFNVIDITGLHSTGKLKDTGVRRAIFLAAVQGIQENYENLNFILSKLNNLDRVKYCICTDVKLINIICGIQSCAATHPCPYCNSNDIKNFESIAEHRTIGSIKQSALAFHSAGSVKKDAKLYINCINQPLLTGDDNALIIDICAPPELHLMQGIVKHIYDNMAKEWPGVSMWLEKINVKQKDYHHGAFVGNDCMKMLKNIDILQQIAEDQNVHTVAKYIHIYKCLQKVILSCFGMELDLQYKTHISNFKDVYIDLGISVSPKVHILVNMYHILLRNTIVHLVGTRNRHWRAFTMILSIIVGKNSVIRGS